MAEFEGDDIEAIINGGGWIEVPGAYEGEPVVRTDRKNTPRTVLLDRTDPDLTKESISTAAAEAIENVYGT